MPPPRRSRPRCATTSRANLARQAEIEAALERLRSVMAATLREREALKRQAQNMVDKGTKKVKKKKKPKMKDEGGESPAKGAASTSMGAGMA